MNTNGHEYSLASSGDRVGAPLSGLAARPAAPVSEAPAPFVLRVNTFVFIRVHSWFVVWFKPKRKRRVS